MRGALLAAMGFFAVAYIIVWSLHVLGNRRQGRGDAGALGDAGLPSVQFPIVSNYVLQIAPATYDVAVVRAAAYST